MARTLYGATAADIAAQVGGDGDYEPSAGGVFDALTTRTGSTAITDLQTYAGSSRTTVIPDTGNDFRFLFWGSDDDYDGPIWLRDQANPSKPRYLVNPVNLTDRVVALEAAGVDVEAATTTTAGIVELATAAEMTTGTDAARVPAVNVVRGAIDAAATPAASETVAGKVERATDAEVATGTDTTRYVSPKHVADQINDHSHGKDDLTDVDFNDFASVTQTPLVIRYGASPPNRSTASSDPDQPVWWQGQNPPTVTGTGSTGAVVGDLFTAGTFV